MKRYCEDCKCRMYPRNWFMVHNHLWEQYGVGKKWFVWNVFRIEWVENLEEKI